MPPSRTATSECASIRSRLVPVAAVSLRGPARTVLRSGLAPSARAAGVWRYQQSTPTRQPPRGRAETAAPDSLRTRPRMGVTSDSRQDPSRARADRDRLDSWVGANRPTGQSQRDGPTRTARAGWASNTSPRFELEATIATVTVCSQHRRFLAPRASRSCPLIGM